jgi:superfamily II DNA/RNA helicase
LSHPVTPTVAPAVNTTRPGPHHNTNVVQGTASADFKPVAVNPAPRPEVPCIILSQVIDPRVDRDVALKNHYLEKVILTRSAMIVRFHKNALHDFLGTIQVYEVPRNIRNRGRKLLEDFEEMSCPNKKKVLVVSFDRKKVQEYDGLVRKAGGESEVLISGDKSRMWARDAFSNSDLPLLITTSVGTEGIKWRECDDVIIADVPSEKLTGYEGSTPRRIRSFKAPYHFLVEAIGRVGRLGREGRVKIYFDPQREEYARNDLLKLLEMTNSDIPDFLVRAGNTDTNDFAHAV